MARPRGERVPKGAVNHAYVNQSVQRALSILNSFTMESRALSLRELSNRVGIHRSTVYRIAANLIAAGFLKYDEPSGKYALGLRLFELGAVVLNDMSLPIKARPLLEGLRDRTNETVHLGVLDATDVVYVEKFESSQSLKLSGLYGSRRPLYSTALGRVLLAGLADNDARALICACEPLVARTQFTLCDVSDILRQVEEIRETGCAYDDQETEIGLRCIAAPVRDFSGNVVAAVGISGPSFRIDGAQGEAFAKAVVETAANISREIGYCESDLLGTGQVNFSR